MHFLIFILIVTLNADRGGRNENTSKHENPFPCSKCDYVVKGYHNNGEKLKFKPGQVICFSAALRYEKVVFSDLKGSPDNPIVIRNCGGQAIVSSPGGFAVKFENSENFRLIGDGDSGIPYGIKMTTKTGFYLTLEKFTTDFEITRIEIAGSNEKGLGEDAGFAGIGIKTSPYQDCELFADSTRKAWVMRNIRVHHNYVHDTGGEGMYIGHGFYKGRIEAKCTVKTWSHSIVGLRVHDNIIENTGFDGIQIKNADEDCEIYNNIIRNFGNRNDGAHNEGLFIGEGVTGKIYNNFIDTGTGHGISFQGMGNNEFYNNVILHAGEDGFNASGSRMGTYIPNGYFRIYNNTIYNSGKNGFVFYHNDGGRKTVVNNLVVRAGKKLTSRGAVMDSSNNIFTQKTSAILFRDTLHSDLRLKKGSPAINHGIDVRIFNPAITCDFLKAQRPIGKGFDIGAYEFEEDSAANRETGSAISKEPDKKLHKK